MPSFEPVERVARVMRGFPRPWFIAGGWAIDVFLGRVTRDHGDVDVALLRRDQMDLRAHFAGWDLAKVVTGRREPWRAGERLELPVHEVHAHREFGAPADVEFLLSESSGGLWVFRRNPRVTRPLSSAGMRSGSGIPFLAPEVVLLFKAKDLGPKDAADFDAAIVRLEAEPRAWLRGALDRSHPGHPWIARL